jgi:hypothetical protein
MLKDKIKKNYLEKAEKNKFVEKKIKNKLWSPTSNEYNINGWNWKKQYETSI